MKLYDREGKIRGWLEGNKAYNQHGQVVGWYEESVDKTYDRNHRIVGSGDQRALLLED